MEEMEWLVEHMLVVQKNHEEDCLEINREYEMKKKQRKIQEEKFYREFYFSDNEYYGQVDQMYSESYFADVEMNNSSPGPKFRAKNKPMSSKERLRRAAKKQKEEEIEANWITIGNLHY